MAADEFSTELRRSVLFAEYINSNVQSSVGAACLFNPGKTMFSIVFTSQFLEETHTIQMNLMNLIFDVLLFVLKIIKRIA